MENMPKEILKNHINIDIDNFLKERHTSTSNFLSKIFDGSQELEIFKDAEFIKRMGNIFPLMEEGVLQEVLVKSDCPDILGELVAHYGSANLQNSYLFGDNYSDIEVAEKFVRIRPKKIKNRFLQRGILEVVSPLLQYDVHSYLEWAKDLGFDIEFDVGKSWEIADAKHAFYCWEEDNLLSPRRQMEEKYMTSDDKSRNKETLQAWIFEALGQMGYDYHHNGWSNGYGFLSRNIRDWLFHGNYGIKSKIVKQSVRVDATIISAKNVYPYYPFEFEVSSALQRLDSVVAAWCKKHPDPIFLSKS